MQHLFELSGRHVRLWQNPGESYDHVLLKALGYAMFVGEFPHLLIEQRVGLRYKPDLIAVNRDGGFDLWAECGLNTVRKTAWVMKHANTRKMVLLKMNGAPEQLALQLRDEILEKYRTGGRLTIVSFRPGIRDLTANRQIAKVPNDLFTEIIV